MVSRTSDIEKFFNKSCPLAPEGFEANSDGSYLQALEECRVLVIGAGGLGCELLKNLALSGFKNIDVIDMDTIDVSNLNSKNDVGKPKAEVAAKFIRERCPGVNVTPYFGKIQDKDEDYYAQFQIIIAGLDSVEARRWINCMLVNMVETNDDGEIDDVTSVIPLIDGGTEGFKGHARVVLPRLSSCFECSLELFPPQVNYPMCTLATNPRLPEHCVEYALQMVWPKERPNDKLDTDNAEHMLWLYERAKERADEFGIAGVTFKKTQGVVKHIIPAIASTNAAIAAAEVNEALKYVTGVAPSLETYMMYNGVTGLYSHTFDYERKADCAVCGTPSVVMSMARDATVANLLERLQTHPQYQLKKPSLRTATQSVYLQGAMAAQMAPNLEKPLIEFAKHGDIVSVTDPFIPRVALEVEVRFE